MTPPPLIPSAPPAADENNTPWRHAKPPASSLLSLDHNNPHTFLHQLPVLEPPPPHPPPAALAPSGPNIGTTPIAQGEALVFAGRSLGWAVDGHQPV